MVKKLKVIGIMYLVISIFFLIFVIHISNQLVKQKNINSKMIEHIEIMDKNDQSKISLLQNTAKIYIRSDVFNLYMIILTNTISTILFFVAFIFLFYAARKYKKQINKTV